MTAKLVAARFEVVDRGREGLEVVPHVDDVPLAALVTEFEASKHYDVVGGYAALMLGHFNFGDVSRYLLGEPGGGRATASWRCWGCEYGEPGCWPLLAQVGPSSGQVVWDHFEQPHRKQRDYSSFGPFSFGGEQYRASAANVAAALS